MSGTPLLVLFAAGQPVPQGSKKAWISKGTGKVMMREDQGDRHTLWRLKVTTAAREALYEAGMTAPLTAAVTVSLTFYFTRGVSHYRSGRNAQLLKDDAPDYPHKPPDVDKLVRAVFDSLTDAKVWADDAQVVSVTARKRFVDRFESNPEGVQISLALMPALAKEAKPEQPVLGL